MKKKYLIEFTHSSGETEIVELVTDEIIEEGTTNNKQMLFG